MTIELYKQNTQKGESATAAVEAALQARISLWDSVYVQIQSLQTTLA